MFNDLTPLHSYDPLAILRLIYRLLFGGATTVSGGAADWATQTHESLVIFLQNLPYYLINFFAKYIVFSVLLSLALIILLIIYEIRRRVMVVKIMTAVLPKEEIEEENPKEVFVANAKWELVEEHINSDDSNKWKLAIVEADIILSELLERLNLPGNGVGEKLKNVEESDFDHIEEAWEAHKIRNAIAHQGSEFVLNQREAKRVIRLYKSVFEEFEII